MIKFAASSEIFKTSKKSQLIYCQSVSFPSILNTIETIFKVEILNRINIFLAKRNLNKKRSTAQSYCHNNIKVCSFLLEPIDTQYLMKINEKKKIKDIFFNQFKYEFISNFIYTHTKSKFHKRSTILVQ